MKKTLITFAGCCISMLALAQQFGVSGQAVVWMQRPREIQVDMGWGQDRIMKTGISPAAGFRVEGNYFLPGFNIPVSGYNGLGVTYFPGITDSTFFYADPASGSGSPVPIAGTQKTSILSIGLRFGYEVPQEFNDFLLIHYGFGFSYMRTKSQRILPEQSSTFNYTSSDFDAETFEPVKDGGMGIEILAGAIYEFESFSIFGQYSVVLQWGGFEERNLRHGPTVGFFYPLYRMM